MDEIVPIFIFQFCIQVCYLDYTNCPPRFMDGNFESWYSVLIMPGYLRLRNNEKYKVKSRSKN